MYIREACFHEKKYSVQRKCALLLKTLQDVWLPVVGFLANLLETFQEQSKWNLRLQHFNISLNLRIAGVLRNLQIRQLSGGPLQSVGS